MQFERRQALRRDREKLRRTKRPVCLWWRDRVLGRLARESKPQRRQLRPRQELFDGIEGALQLIMDNAKRRVLPLQRQEPRRRGAVETANGVEQQFVHLCGGGIGAGFDFDKGRIRQKALRTRRQEISQCLQLFFPGGGKREQRQTEGRRLGNRNARGSALRSGAVKFEPPVVAALTGI